MKIRVKVDSSAFGDDTQPIVFEIPKAIRTALDQLHLAVESFGDPVVAREAPHAGDRFDPVIEGIGERLQESRGLRQSLGG